MTSSPDVVGLVERLLDEAAYIAGAKGFTGPLSVITSLKDAASALEALVKERDEAPTHEDDIAADAILYQCADCLEAEYEFSCYNREDVFVIGKKVICRECADSGHRGEQRHKVPDLPAKLKRQRMHAKSQQSRAEAAVADLAKARQLVERAFRDGLAHATNVVVTDPDEAWRTSRARAALDTERKP